MKLNSYTLIFILVASTVFRISGIAGKKLFTHDGVISYLAASGKQSDYADSTATQKKIWKKASDWKNFIIPDKTFCFKKIGHDLAYDDIHPPLYFWLLHLWILLIGTSIYSGPLLNCLITIFSTFFLYKLANFVFENKRDALLVAFFFSFSPAVVSISFEARQYDLFAFVSILFFSQVIYSIKGASEINIPRYFKLTLSCLAGLLTHYNFFIMLLVAFILFLTYLFKTGKRQFLWMSLTLLIAFLLFYCLHPNFTNAFRILQDQNTDFKWKYFFPRVDTIILTLSGFFVQINLFKYLFFLVFFVFVIKLLKKKRGKTFRRLLLFPFQKGDFVIYCLVWTSIFLVSSFLFSATPAHSMGAKYLSPVWPFFAFIPVFVFRYFHLSKKVISISIAGTFVFSLIQISQYHIKEKNNSLPIHLIASYDQYLIDNVARGILPVIAWNLPDNGEVFAADQDYLLKHQDLWATQRLKPSLYISDVSYGNTKEKQTNILNILEEKHKITRLNHKFKTSELFEIIDYKN